MQGIEHRSLSRAMYVSRPLRILILGGTGFIGPHYVNAALARGHRVSIFNRGESKTVLPGTVERLVGDRNGNLESIKNRVWDAVIDLASYDPPWVRRLGEALKDRVHHYTFISTVAVYAKPLTARLTGEDADLLTDNAGTSSALEKYGAVKVLCEREAEKHFRGKTLIIRPTYIVGPGDPNGAFTYWPVRMQRGGRMLVAGDPSTPAQFIDVRDLAEWSIGLVEKRTTGIYNAVGPEAPFSLRQLVRAAQDTGSESTTIAWVPTVWLAARQNREMWEKMFWWSFEPEGIAGLMRMSGSRARTSGLVTRAVGATLADTLSWYWRQPASVQARLIPGSHNRIDSVGLAETSSLWPMFLEHEKATLAAWHARSRLM